MTGIEVELLAMNCDIDELSWLGSKVCVSPANGADSVFVPAGMSSVNPTAIL